MSNLQVLRVEFINKVYSGKKIVKETLSGKVWSYRGATKKEAIEKAKKALRYNSSYARSWSIEDANEN